MKKTGLLVISALFALSLAIPAFAADTAKPAIVGTWKVKSDMNGMAMETILLFSTDKDGKLTGKSISFFGATDLKDIKFEANKLTYAQVFKMGGNEITSNFKGELKDGKLTGSVSSDRGDYTVEGGMLKQAPAIVGNWQFTTERNGQTRVSTMSVTQDKDGKFAVVWKSQRGDTPATDVKFENGKLTFKRAMTGRPQGQGAQEQNAPAIEMTYSLTAKGDTISGTMTTQQGERPVEGKLVGGSVIGTWELALSDERGERTQWLMILPDMTGYYGSMAVDKITVDENNKISFAAKISFGQGDFEIQFSGKVEGDKLTGELTSPGFNPQGGSATPSKVTGKKIPAESK